MKIYQYRETNGMEGETWYRWFEATDEEYAVIASALDEDDGESMECVFSVEPADGNPHTKGKSLEEINEYMRTVPGADDWSYTFKYRIAELTEEAKKKISEGTLEGSDFYSLGIFEQ